MHISRLYTRAFAFLSAISHEYEAIPKLFEAIAKSLVIPVFGPGKDIDPVTIALDIGVLAFGSNTEILTVCSLPQAIGFLATLIEIPSTFPDSCSDCIVFELELSMLLLI